MSGAVRVAMLSTLACFALEARAADETLKKWFDDPYFELSHDLASCPEPRAPYITEEEALRESHHRAERGTRCHLEGRCRHPSSFDYDQEIAGDIRAAVRDGRLRLPRSTLWVLVQGRRVFLYGCAGAQYRPGTLERALGKIPDVELAIEQVRRGNAPVPYRTRATASSPGS